MTPTNDLYYKYAGIITSVVNRYATYCPDLRDDLYGEALLVFCDACKSYDPNHTSKAAFSTWLYRQLQSISRVMDKAINGPVPEAHLHCPSADIPFQDALSVVAPAHSLDTYTDSLQQYTSSDFPSDMHKYLDTLRGDSFTIFQDFINGRLDSAPDKYGTISLERKRQKTYLNPTKLYIRRYKRLGWSIDRVRNAWLDVSRVVSSYINGTHPSLTSSDGTI